MSDQTRLEQFMGGFVAELGALLHAPLVITGDQLGLYKAMAGAGPLTPAALAGRTNTTERYVKEWLDAHAAAGWVDYDPAERTYTLPDALVPALADDESPVFVPGAYKVAASVTKVQAALARVFRSGEGFPWPRHNPDLFEGTERFFRPGYLANLVPAWLPALDGVVEKLERGAKVADIGCGHGSSTVILGQTYPNSTVVGFDNHAGSIETARKRAADAGVADRVTFEVAGAADFPGTGYDLVTVFDALHDMGDPVGAASHVHGSLAPDGTWMVVEPNAGDRPEDNHNPVGRIFYSASTFICCPHSRSEPVGLALGAQAGEARLRDVFTQGGFTRIRRAAETPFNVVLEARP